MIRWLQIMKVFLLFSSFFSGINETLTKTLKVEVQELRSPNGQVFLALHSSLDGLLSYWRYAKEVPQARTESKKIPAYPYAIIDVYDENRNSKMSKNFIYLPIERFRASNNQIFYKPQRFEPASFQLDSKIKPMIKLI